MSEKKCRFCGGEIERISDGFICQDCGKRVEFIDDTITENENKSFELVEEKPKYGRTKISVIALSIVAVLGFAFGYVWDYMGLSEAVNEKTLNISYDEFMYEENIQSLNLQMEKTYEGGYFFDKYTVYESVKIHNSVEENIKITVDNSKNEIEKIAIYFDVDNSDELLSAQIKSSLLATYFSTAIDKNITEDARSNITNMLFNLVKSGEYMDSCVFHDIKYSVGLIDDYAFVITPNN